METILKLYNMKGVDPMTKIEKLEREKKIWKYVPIGTTVFLLLGGETLFILFCNNDINKIIVFSIMLVVFSVINYFFQRYNAKEAIANCECDIKLEHLKTEIKKQFNLSTEEYVEVFWNAEAYKSENPVEIAFTVHGLGTIRPDSRLKKVAMQDFFGAKFYAKLISEDEIEIIVEYNGGAEKGEPLRIRNFTYFKKYFKTEH